MTDETQQAQKQAVGFDDLMEDLVGLNIRGLKTIWVLFSRPAQYFVAAKTPNWQDRFTPSFRVWFAVMAIGTALKFIWAGDNSAMLRLYIDMTNQIITDAGPVLAAKDKMFDLTTFDPAISAQYLIKYSYLFLPFTYFFFLVLLAAVYRAWGETLGFVVRLRYVFAVIIPGSLLGFISAVLMMSLPSEVIMAVNWFAMLVMFASYFFVAYFGAYANLANGSRFGRSILLTVLIIIAVMLATIVAMIPAMLMMISNTFPEVVPLIETASQPNP